MTAAGVSRGGSPAELPPVTDELVEAVQRRVADARTEPEGAAIATALRAELPGPVSDAAMLRLLRIMENELRGSGVLEPLLADPRTTDVVVNAPDDVRVDRGDGWEPTDVRFPDEAAVQRLARRLAAAAGRRLDEALPYVDARLPDGTRLHAVIPPVAVSGACLSLRVLRPSRHDLDRLAGSGTLPGAVAPVLRAVIDARLAFLIGGGTGSGKTTLLGAVLAAVPEGERVVVVEDAEELRPAHPHVVRLVGRIANVEGAGAVPLRELVRQALRMRPDRIVLGEVRGPEVVELLAALNTGHEGGGGTLHANTAAEVPARLEALAAMAGLDRTALHAQLAGAVQVVLQMRRTPTGRVLSTVGVTRRTGGGPVEVIPAVADGAPVLEGMALLRDLLAGRGIDPPC
ncbi:TadA family conjugal transfer-associated ATPase [Nakamurella sp. YIM 132087]|uniref:TadA family conjugal transfer-associated ATPase n=1 Tax=Nakamurella alba TaxID=2665158 RepID=A0A7K1FSC7_9ACTN|nr:TadA family conjugal transfer-associated ATPase [Nakamurella alba]MTD17041.1 TadA family conjugal transfer-associated ATPase [Nakamurella alba]